MGSVPVKCPGVDIYEGCVWVVGTEEKTASARNELQITPNPSNGHITFKLSPPGKGTVTVYTMQGVAVYRKSFPAIAENTIDLSALPAGLYNFGVQTRGDNYTRKIVIQH